MGAQAFLHGRDLAAFASAAYDGLILPTNGIPSLGEALGITAKGIAREEESLSKRRKPEWRQQFVSTNKDIWGPAGAVVRESTPNPVFSAEDMKKKRHEEAIKKGKH